MISYNYAELKSRMESLAQTESNYPECLEEKMLEFLNNQRCLPPECSELIFWMLAYDLALTPIVRCFDWYRLSDVYQKLIVQHEDMPRIILEYIRRHPSLESEELADFLWFAYLCRLAAQNAWQLSYVERLELFQAFVQNMTVYAAHTIQAKAWNNEDIGLFTPEVRLTYHVNQAYACLEQNDLEGYAQYLDMAGDDCPDLCACIEALKAIPEQKESPLQGMNQEEIQVLALRRVGEIKKAFYEEDWLKTAELIKAFDRDGFEAKTDFELLKIQCQLAERGLLW